MTNAQLEELQALVAEYQPLRHHEVVHFLKCSFRTAPAQPNGWVREYVPRMIRTLLDNLEVLNAENERLRALVSGELTASELQLFNVFASVKDGGVLPATVFQIAGLRRLEEIPPYNPNSVKDGDA